MGLGLALMPNALYAATPEGFGTAETSATIPSDEDLNLEDELGGLLDEEQILIAQLEEKIATLDNEDDKATAIAILKKIVNNPSPLKRERMLKKMGRLMAKEPETRDRIFAGIREKHRQRLEETQTASNNGVQNGRFGDSDTRTTRDTQDPKAAQPAPGDFATPEALAAGATDTAGTQTGSGTDNTGASTDKNTAKDATKDTAPPTDPNTQTAAAETGSGSSGGGGGGGGQDMMKKLMEEAKKLKELTGNGHMQAADTYCKKANKKPKDVQKCIAANAAAASQ
jgi:hypothetical protein